MGRFIGENITGKILALFLAIVLWVYVMNDQNPPIEQTVSAKLEVRNAPQGLFVTDAPEGVKIRLRGPRSIIAGMRSQDIGAYIDAHGLAEGEHTVNVKPLISAALEVLEILPKTVTIHIESQVSRQVPVTPKFIGTMPPGMIISKAAIKPNTVTITGPRSKVEAVDTAAVVLSLDGLERDIIQESQPKAYMRNGVIAEQVTVMPEKVQLELSVQGMSSKKVDINPVLVGSIAPGRVITSITTEPEKIGIKGQPEAVKVTEWLNTQPIDITGQSKDIIREVKLQLREGILLEQGGDTIKVIIRIAAQNASR